MEDISTRQAVEGQVELMTLTMIHLHVSEKILELTKVHEMKLLLVLFITPVLFFLYHVKMSAV